VLVVGAGFFGGLVAARLEDVGTAPLVAARSGGDIRMDAEDERSLRECLRPGDVVVDTAGPFAWRTTRLIRAALEIGCDVIDLAESLAWSEAVLALGQRAADAGVRLSPACSAVAAVAGACVRASGIVAPDSVDLFLAPASAETASPATVRGFIATLGRPIRTLRDGRMTIVRGYDEQRTFPGSSRRGGIVEHAGAALLPRSWPSLRRAEFWVDPNAPLMRALLSVAARVPPAAMLARTIAPLVGAGPFGRHDGVFAVEVREGSRRATSLFSAPRRSYLVAVEPAVIVAEALARGASPPAGVLLPHAQVDPEMLHTRLRGLGIRIDTDAAPAGPPVPS
jgi:saccharopine dehydrogenase-like NADP-dependent oxidoreductase